MLLLLRLCHRRHRQPGVPVLRCCCCCRGLLATPKAGHAMGARINAADMPATKPVAGCAQTRTLLLRDSGRRAGSQPEALCKCLWNDQALLKPSYKTQECIHAGVKVLGRPRKTRGPLRARSKCCCLNFSRLSGLLLPAVCPRLHTTEQQSHGTPAWPSGRQRRPPSAAAALRPG